MWARRGVKSAGLEFKGGWRLIGSFPNLGVPYNEDYTVLDRCWGPPKKGNY